MRILASANIASGRFSGRVLGCEVFWAFQAWIRRAGIDQKRSMRGSMIFAWFRRSALAAAAVLISALLASFTSAAEARSKEVLVLHSFGRDFRPWSEYAKAIRLELERQSPWPLDIQEHALVTARSSNDNPEAAFVDYLHALFSKRPPDLIVSVGAPAAHFVQQHRQRLFPSTPMVLTVVDQRRVQYSALGPNDTVVAVAIDYHAAIKSILQLLPETNHVAMVVGKSPIEKFWKDEIARESKALEGRVEITWYDTFSFEEILAHAANLPPNSVIFWELMIVDAAGVIHEEGKALSRLHAVANAPIFSYTDAFFGREIVGGPHVPVLEAGKQVAAVAVRILNGESAGLINVPPVRAGVPKFDWREMQRWGIDEARLPPGSEIHFRSPTPWQRYRIHILAACAAILLQVLVILWLLYEQRRRHAAEMLARGTMAELHNVNKLAAAGELSASIAHEVKQPLTVVATNAYAALNWLAMGRPDLDEARKSLNKIVAATHRANDIISGVRAMFVSDERDEAPIDLNEIIMSVLRIGRPNLRSHNVELETQLDEDLPRIFANRVQLQQVILNLVMNAVESMQLSVTRKLRVRSERTASAGVRVAIEDTGTGIDPADLGRIFKPLFTTKKRGMGMGLVICRSIVEAHGGRISAAPAPQGGTVFEFELPAQSLRAAV
jgi:signal transduction histidine kinase